MGRDPRFAFVRGNVYTLPLADAAVDTVVMVRVLHHLIDVPRALAELRRILRPGGQLVLEYANKRNAKALARYALRRQVGPFDPEPYEFVTLNFDFHPAWVTEQLRMAHFDVRQELAVSHFRAPFFKRFLPAPRSPLDGALQRPARYKLAPSVFVRAQAVERPIPAPSLHAC
ncbi:MAG: class I SAM-dependent methyltransferase [Anaerolineae bacterium]|nr:MAG: class I SAM-dependent methyltransferase [Anaerolineae bacterium]